MENQAIDIWTNDYLTFSGFISNYTQEVGSSRINGKRPKAPVFFNSKINLKPRQAKEIFNLFNQSGLFHMPSDKNIKGWSYGFDGEEYLFEYSTKSMYSFKAYWTPSIQKDLPEANSMNMLNQKLRSILNLNQEWQAFTAGLPPGTYRYGEMLMMRVMPQNDNLMSNGAHQLLDLL